MLHVSPKDDVGPNSPILSTVFMSNFLPFLACTFSYNCVVTIVAVSLFDSFLNYFRCFEKVRTVTSTDGGGSEVEVEVQVHGVEFVKLLYANCGQTLCLSDFDFTGNRFWRIVTSDGVEPCHAKRFPYVPHLLSSGNLAVLVPDLVKGRCPLVPGLSCWSLHLSCSFIHFTRCV